MAGVNSLTKNEAGYHRNRVFIKSISEEATFEQIPEGSEEGAMWISAGRAFQAEETAYAKALRY